MIYLLFLFAFHFPFQSESFAIVYGAHSGTIVLTKERCLERIARGDISIFILERLCICAAKYILHCEKNYEINTRNNQFTL